MIIRLLLFLLAGYVALKVFKSLFGTDDQKRMAKGAGHTGDIDNLMVKDLNCQTYISKKDAVRAERNGDTFYFCSRECRDNYLANH
jgi:YHS domain-containing protein